jgi:hypothetical protein
MVTAALVLLAFCVGILGLLVAGLLTSHAAILRQLHELTSHDDGASFQTRPGVATPRTGSGGPVAIAGTDPAGDPVSVALTGRSNLTLLAFLSSGCLTCRGFWQALREPRELDLPDEVRPVIVTKDPQNEQVALVRDLAPTQVTTVMSTAAWDDYEVPVAPYFILVDGSSAHVVGEGAAATWGQLSDLMAQALADTRVLDRIRRRPGATGRRDRDTDEALLRAGIRPGDSRLFGSPAPVDERGGE